MDSPRESGKRNGFTLIELVIVMAIIALLSTLVVPEILGIRRKSRVRMCFIFLEEIRTAQDIYRKDTGATAFTNSVNDLTPYLDESQNNWGCVNNPAIQIQRSADGEQYTIVARPLKLTACSISVTNIYGTRIYDYTGFKKLGNNCK